MASEMEPCPFCHEGLHHARDYDGDPTFAHPESGCILAGKAWDVDGFNYAAWNTRPVPAPVGVNGIAPEVLRRYETMIEAQGIRWPECVPDPGTDLAHLTWMLAQMYGGMDTDKANRWLGFIQGCLISRGLTTVTEERDFTRPFFAALTPQTSEAGE